MSTAEADPMIGRTVGGRFTILERVGQGGMGVVYRASQEHVARDVAIKVLQPDRGDDEAAAEQFLGEAQAISQLTSPHTVTLIDAGPLEEGGWFIAMELLEGETLRDRLAAGRLDVEDAVRIVDQVTLSLSEAHARGIVHRDLKPSNIFLAQTPGHAEAVKVLDFGLAAAVRRGDGRVAGTPRYMAPEAIAGMRSKPAADVYAVGLILHEMFAGEHPFAGLRGEALLQAQLDHVPAPIEADDVPSSLRKVVARCLAKSPRMRFRDGEALRRALREAAGLPAEEAAPPRGSIPSPDDAPSSTLATLPSTLSTEALRARLLGDAPGPRRWLVPMAGLAGLAGLLIWRGAAPEPMAPPPAQPAQPAQPPRSAPVAVAPPPSSAEAVPPAPRGHDVLFHTIPDGGTVSVEGRDHGPTPVMVRLAAETTKVQVRLEGYETTTLEVTPSDGLRVRHVFERPAPPVVPDPVRRRVDHYLD